MPADRNLLEAVCRAAYPDASEIAHLGTGGFACTFRVVQNGSPIAVKVIEPGRIEPERIEREVAALQSVDHPRVVGFIGHHSTTYQSVAYAIVEMEYVEGNSLAHMFADGIAYSLPEAAAMLQEACEGAAAIWLTGTAHRDLSPNNILVGADGHLTIVDLGLCRNVNDETITTFPMPGTPGWMAPEQLQSNATHGDWRSDQFVLGLIGYRLVTGVAPFHGTNVMMRWEAPLRQSIRAANEVDPSIPSAVSALLDRMVQKEPHRRFLQPDKLLAELAAIGQGPVQASNPPSPVAFYNFIGQKKGYVDQVFLNTLCAEGVVLDGAMTRSAPNLATMAGTAGSIVVADPVTHHGRSPLTVRTASYRSLPYGSVAIPTAPLTAAQITVWARRVLAAFASADIVVAPYWYAALGEIEWIRASLDAGVESARIVAANENDDRRIWTGLAVSSTWLAQATHRNTLLAAITASQCRDLYLLVHTTQGSFRPLENLDTLVGFRDLLQVLREAGTNVVVGSRASSGLLLLALGASGWSTGVSSIQQNFEPHHMAAQTGGPAQDRAYVPRLLSALTTATVVNFLRTDPQVLDPQTPYIQQILAANPSLTDITTEQRYLLLRHNISAQRAQAAILAGLQPGPRIQQLRDWLDDAQTLYLGLPAGARVDETSTFIPNWRSVL